MPANNADKIGAMIESAKNRLMGTPVAGVGGIPDGAVAGGVPSANAPKPSGPGAVGFWGLPTPQRTPRPAEPPPPDLMDQIQNPEKYNNQTGKPISFGAVNQPLLNMVKEGATKPIGVPESSSDGYTPGPFGANPAEGGRLTSFNLNDKEMEEWKARGALSYSKNPEYLALEKERSNPNNAMFNDIVKKLVDITSTGPAVGRATNVAALKGALQALAPLTSYGQFGVAGMQAETKKRDQDITSETTRRGQDIEGAIKKPYYEANAEESKAKSRLYGTQAKLLEEEGKPDKVREKEVSGWLTERRKIKNAALEGMTDMTPEEQDKRIAALDALFVKTNPAPIWKAKQNADGTVTVEYADGRVVTGKPKK